MTVKIIRRTVETHEVTDDMRTAAAQQAHIVRSCGGSEISYESIYKAMEAARVAESGVITKIEMSNRTCIEIKEKGIRFEDQDDLHQVWVEKEDIRPLADALIELDKQINGGK